MQIPDFVRAERYTHVELIVPAPTERDPIPCLLVSVSTGPRCRVFFRLPDLAAYDAAFRVPEKARERLARGLQEARELAAEINEDQRLMCQAHAGEIVAQAERVIRDAGEDQGQADDGELTR